MYVCVCNAITESHIRELFDQQKNVKEIMACTGAGTNCKRCMPFIAKLSKEYNEKKVR